MIDYTKILERRFFGSEWTLNGNDYEGLTWLSDTPKPTKSKLDSLWDKVVAEIEAEKQAKIVKKLELLNRLGLTEDEAKLLFS